MPRRVLGLKDLHLGDGGDGPVVLKTLTGDDGVHGGAGDRQAGGALGNEGVVALEAQQLVEEITQQGGEIGRRAVHGVSERLAASLLGYLVAESDDGLAEDGLGRLVFDVDLDAVVVAADAVHGASLCADRGGTESSLSAHHAYIHSP